MANIKAHKKTISEHTSLMKEWLFEKNISENPEKLLFTSKKKVWWRCPEGHEYKMTIDNRTSGGKCPYCSGKAILTGFNDLATTDPELLSEWDYDKNSAEGIEPTIVMRNSEKKVWWKCSKNHKYQMTINKRTKGYNCPECDLIKGKQRVQEEIEEMQKFFQEKMIKHFLSSRKIIEETNLYQILSCFGWVYYINKQKQKEFDDNKVGKWMFFFCDKVFAAEICKRAVFENIVNEAKHSEADKGVCCFYLNIDDIEAHKRCLNFFLENNLIRKTKAGRLYNISFKLDNQTRNNEYGNKFKAQIKLADFIDLNTGKWRKN